MKFSVEAEKTIPITGGGRLILQRVAEPIVPPISSAVAVPPVTSPQERAARLAKRAGEPPTPKETRLLWFHVTVYGNGASYVEWWPDVGGKPFAVWSRADFRYIDLISQFEMDGTRYLLFPTTLVRPRSVNQVVPPDLPGDGPGFMLAEGDRENSGAIAPIAELHRIYKERAVTLKAAWEQQESVRAVEAARPVPPPGDVVIRFWPLRSEPGSQTTNPGTK